MAKKKTTKKKTKKVKTAAKSKKTNLKASDLKKYENLLFQKRAEILGDVNHMKQETLKKERSDLSNVPFHMADAGSDNYEMENTLGLMDEEVKLLAEIDDALARIELKTYGICEGSGKAIPKARLEAIPWARYCVEYKELLEKGLVEAPEVDYEYDREHEDDDSDLDEEEAEDEDDELDEVMDQLDSQMALMGDDEGDDENDDYDKH
jgi:RNA polymerase-binding protein DksA